MSRVSAEYRDARRAHIVATARDLFADKGLAHTSMSDLVAAAGISMGGFYRYFDSKEALIAAVAEGRDGSVEGEYPATESPEGLLARLLSYVSEPENGAHARLVAQIWGDAAVRPQLAEVVRARHTALCEHFASLICKEDRAAQTAEVALAALIGYSLLVAAGFEVDQETFHRTLSLLLPADEAQA